MKTFVYQNETTNPACRALHGPELGAGSFPTSCAPLPDGIQLVLVCLGIVVSESARAGRQQVGVAADRTQHDVHPVTVCARALCVCVRVRVCVCVPFHRLGRDRPPWHALWHVIVVLVLRHGLPALLRMEVFNLPQPLGADGGESTAAAGFTPNFGA